MTKYCWLPYHSFTSCLELQDELRLDLLGLSRSSLSRHVHLLPFLRAVTEFASWSILESRGPVVNVEES